MVSPPLGRVECSPCPWAELRASREHLWDKLTLSFQEGTTGPTKHRKLPAKPREQQKRKYILRKVLSTKHCSVLQPEEGQRSQARSGCVPSLPQGFVSVHTGGTSRNHPQALPRVTHCSAGACPGTGSSSAGSRSSRAQEPRCPPCCPRAPRCEPRGAGSWSP